MTLITRTKKEGNEWEKEEEKNYDESVLIMPLPAPPTPFVAA